MKVPVISYLDTKVRISVMPSYLLMGKNTVNYYKCWRISAKIHGATVTTLKNIAEDSNVQSHKPQNFAEDQLAYSQPSNMVEDSDFLNDNPQIIVDDSNVPGHNAQRHPRGY